MAIGRLGLILVLGLGVVGLAPTVSADVEILPTERTADMPDSWLVLYNIGSADSIEWANWYQLQRGIPSENMIGLIVPLDEHLPDLAAAQSVMVAAVRDLLDNDPVLESKIMGIILGYNLPGHYATSFYGGPGGYSLADALEDMYDDELPPGPTTAGGQQGQNRHDNPQFGGNILPLEGRPTKAWMEQHRYMTARIDGPTVEDAKALTLRAKAIEDPNHYIFGEYVWYDYTDSALPGSTWYWLKWAVEETALPDVPWMVYDSDTQQTPNDAFRFGTHDIDGWNDDRLFHPNAGSRILAFDYDSWGATTVRDTSAEGGRFVPNALAAGYAAAIGSTGEPACCLGPIPETLLAGLREGWTLGESFHISAVYDDWTWTLVGDPFLTVPHWFDEPAPTVPGTSDMNGDGNVNGLDIEILVGVFSGAIQHPDLIAAADVDNNQILNDDDLFLFFGPSLHNSYDPNVLRGSGDVDGDGDIDGDDITAFVDRLFNGLQGDEPLRIQFGPDMNQDGDVTIEDVPLFVDALLR
ncbi:MAG: hypothetical protein ABII12_01620 [Planctomycetota bacterium]